MLGQSSNQIPLLRRIVKENHGTPILQTSTLSRGNHNIVATLSGSQVNIYDNQHLGDHLDIVSNFTVESQSFGCTCWILLPDDSYILVSQGSMILVISFTMSRVIKELKGHSKPIISLVPHPSDSNLFVSLSLDGTMRLWHLEAGIFLAVFSCSATTACIHANGTKVICGTEEGNIQEWLIPDDVISISSEQAQSMPVEYIDECLQIPMTPHEGVQIDSVIAFDEQLISKSSNGIIVVWELQPEYHPTQVIQAKSCKGNDAPIGLSFDKTRVCIATNNGKVIVYQLKDGKKLHEASHKRSTKCITNCIFTYQDKGILFADEDSVIWRFDYMDPPSTATPLAADGEDAEYMDE